MNYKILKDELALPLYSTMTDAQAAAELNKTITVIKPKKLTTLMILDILGSTNGANFIVALENISATNDAVRLATRSMDSVGVDVGNTTTRTMIDTLVAGSILNATDAQTIKDAANVATTRAQELGCDVVTNSDIKFARTGEY